MESSIKQKYISARGKVGTPDELQIDDDITVTLTIVEIADRTNNDGTVDRTYRGQLFAPEVWDGKNITVEKGGKSISQRIRSALFVYWQNHAKEKMSFEEFYSKWGEKKIEEIKEEI